MWVGISWSVSRETLDMQQLDTRCNASPQVGERAAVLRLNVTQRPMFHVKHSAMLSFFLQIEWREGGFGTGKVKKQSEKAKWQREASNVAFYGSAPALIVGAS